MTRRREIGFLLLRVMAWLAAGFIGATVTAAVLMAGSFAAHSVLGLGPAADPSQSAYVLTAACGFQITLLVGAFWQARRAGNGAREGAGIRPIQRKPLIAGLCAATAIWLAGLIILMSVSPALRAFARSSAPATLADLTEGGPVIIGLRLLLVAVLAPVSEELFFRGWLWEAARRAGLTLPATMLLTAVPWLLLHGLDSPGRIIFLLPAAAMFSAARHFGGGMPGSLATHLTNNAFAVAIQAIPILTGAR